MKEARRTFVVMTALSESGKNSPVPRRMLQMLPSGPKVPSTATVLYRLSSDVRLVVSPLQCIYVFLMRTTKAKRPYHNSCNCNAILTITLCVFSEVEITFPLSIILTFKRRNFLLNFSTPCI